MSELLDIQLSTYLLLLGVNMFSASWSPTALFPDVSLHSYSAGGLSIQVLSGGAADLVNMIAKQVDPNFPH